MTRSKALVPIGLTDKRSVVHVDVVRLVKTKLLIQANSGGGKSWCLRRLLEKTHGQLQHLVIDPEGEFATLREKYDYVLAAKKGGDTVADPRSAKLLAERLLELGVSAILDIYELKAHDRIQFVKLFVEALVDAPKKYWHPALVVLDEAHVYCPEQGKAESAGAVIDLSTRGRKRGFCAVLATQRLAKLHKDAAAEANNKLIGRTGLDVDLKRAADDLGFGKDRWPDLRKLREGQFFAFGPAISTEVVRVQIGGVRTSHPSAGARLGLKVPPPTAKVKALLPKLADLPAEAEERQRTNVELKKQILQLKRELAKKPAPPAPITPKRVEVPVLAKSDLVRVEASVSALKKFSAALQGELGALSASLAKVASALARVSQNGHGTSRSKAIARPAVVQKPRIPPRPTQPADGALPASRQRIVDALAFLEGIGLERANKVQLALMADVSPASSGYTNNLGALRGAGIIDYPVPSFVALTDAGRGLANADAAPSTTEELHNRVRAKLPAAKWKLLEVAIGRYPDALTKDELAELAGVSRISSGYTNNLGSLRSLGLIEYPSPGHVVAQPVLFLEAR